MISLIDVVNCLDTENAPIGHGIKILRELPELLEYDAEILASKEYLQKIERKKKGTILPYCRQLGMKGRDVKVLCNYIISLFKAKGSILIYTNVVEALLWGIALFKGKRKIIVVTYEHWDKYMENNLHSNPVRKFLVRRGLARLDGCIVTNLLYKPSVPYINIPDYFITDEIRKFYKKEKRNESICLGEVRDEKDVEGLVRVMAKTHLPLFIAGSFEKKETYQKIRRLQTDNIKIENRNLPYDTYLEYLSSYKYVILPYNVKRYDGRTSGVLLEGIFLGAIPIAPCHLLEQNQIQGLGYQNISEIPALISKYETGEISIQNTLEKYTIEKHKNRINQFLMRISKD